MLRGIKAALRAMAELADTFYCNECSAPYATYGEAMACALQHHRDKYGK